MYASSRHFARLLSRILLMVMLATVFAPGFGWQALEGGSGHEIALAAGEPQVIADEADCHGHHAAHAATGEHDEAPAGGNDLSHHCCPGHVLGHLLAGLSGSALPMPPQDGAARIEGAGWAFSPRIPEGLERPPRVAA